MKIIQFGDVHLDVTSADNVLPALAELEKRIEIEAPSLIINTGDLSMRRGHLAPWVGLRLREFHVALQRIAPVIVCAGNHDLAAPGEPGTVRGVLEFSECNDEDHGLSIYEQPWVGEHVALWRGGRVCTLAVLPYPHRAWMLARREVTAADLHEVMSAELLACLQGLAAETMGPALLIFHGTVAGARSASELAMTTGMDLVLNERDIPACFAHVLCGHIHRPQTIGRCVYNGSLAPLTFAEERCEHGYVVWEGEGVGSLVPRFERLPIAHPLITLDLRKGVTPDLAAIDFAGARVRVLEVGSEPERLRTAWSDRLQSLGASEVRVQVERPEALQLAGPEVHADLALRDLLGIYVARHPDLEPLREALAAEAEQVEAELPAAARLAARFAGYRLLALEWSDWKSYGPGNRLTMDELGAVVGIEGPNATGKSNAAEVEAFALYGRSVRGRQALAECVRAGTEECVVAAEFESGGTIYRVRRTVRINSRGIGAATVSLLARNQLTLDGAPDWAPADRATGRETDAFIESLVGPFELYCATRFASQADIDRLLDLTPAQLTDTLKAALATELFDERLTVATERARSAQRAVDRHEASFAVWRADAARREECEAALLEARAEHVDSMAALEARQQEKEAASARAERTAAALAAIVERAREWDEASARAVAARKRLAEAEAMHERDRQDAACASDLELQMGRLPALRAELDRIGAAREARSRAVLELREAEGRLREWAARLVGTRQKAEADAKAQHAEYAAALRDLNRIAERQAEELGRLERSASLLERVPFGERCAAAGCSFVADAVAARTGLAGRREQFEREQRDANAAVALLLVAATEAREHGQCAVAAEEAAGEPLRAACAAAPALPPEAPEERPVREEIAHLEALGGNLELARAAVARLGQADVALAGLREQAEAAARAAAGLGERPDRGEASNQAESARQGAAAADRAVRAAQEADRAAAATVGRREADLDAVLRAEAALAAGATTGAELEGRATVTGAYAAAVGRDGLPYLMLERALPTLQAHANHFLCDDLGSGLRVTIGALRELQSGATRSEVVIGYDNDFGSHSLAAASGFERIAIGYALRAALAQVQSEARGVRIWHFIADEGWGFFDEPNVVRMGQPMARRIAEQFGRFVLISHVAAILEICDTRLRVVGDPVNGSRLEVVR